jgi:hypothetical protein
LPKFYSVQIYLDDNIPEYMDGLLRIRSVLYIDDNGDEIEENVYEEFEITVRPNDLVNLEYHTGQELEKDVAERVGIDSDLVEIEGKRRNSHCVL